VELSTAVPEAICPRGPPGAHLAQGTGRLLRWDRHNTILLCAQDHLQWAHGHPAEFRQWFQPFTPERFNPNDPLASEVSRTRVRLV
jgi:hypothetical protein